MGNIKERKMKNLTYYVFDDIINITNFDLKLLKTAKKSHKNIDVFYIRNITVKDFDYVKITV